MFEGIVEFFNSPEGKSGLVSLIVLLVGTLVIRFFQPKSKIIWSLSHGFTYFVNNLGTENDGPDSMLFRTIELWIQNTGRKTAENVEIHLNFRPQHFEIFPTRTFSENTNPDGHFTISTPTLSHREHFTIQMLSAGAELPMTLNVSWKDGIGESIPMGPQQIFPPYFLHIIRVILLLGIFTFIYLIVRGIGYLAG